MMRSFSKLSFVGLLVFQLAACSDMNQDPLTGVNEAVKNAKKPETKPEIPRPIESDAVRIFVDDITTIKEGQAAEISISTRTLLEGYTTELEVVNMGAFPGAVYNPVDGVFSWTPPRGTVGSGMTQQKFLLQLRAISIPSDEKNRTLFKQKTVEIAVEKVSSDPVIKSVRLGDINFRENNRHSIYVQVEDQDGGLGQGEAPRLVFGGGSNGRVSLAPFAQITSTRADTNTKIWNIEVNVNLNGVELTDSRVDSVLEVAAISQYNKMSAVQKVTVPVFTDFASTVDGTFEMGSEFFPGTKSSYGFAIYDPKGEAIVSVKATRGLPDGATLNCKDQRKSWVNCKLEWQPDAKDAKKNYNAAVEVEYRNRHNTDIRVVSRTYRFNFQTGGTPVVEIPTVPAPDEGGEN